MTPEGKVKSAVKKLLLSRGVWFYMPIQNGMGVVGIPDFICCFKGKLFAIETKAPGKEKNVTPNQMRQMTGINDAGGVAIVASDVSHVEAALFFMEKSDEG
jgi:hypothetical protein